MSVPARSRSGPSGGDGASPLWEAAGGGSLCWTGSAGGGASEAAFPGAVLPAADSDCGAMISAFATGSDGSAAFCWTGAGTSCSGSAMGGGGGASTGASAVFVTSAGAGTSISTSASGSTAAASSSSVAGTSSSNPSSSPPGSKSGGPTGTSIGGVEPSPSLSASPARAKPGRMLPKTSRAHRSEASTFRPGGEPDRSIEIEVKRLCDIGFSSSHRGLCFSVHGISDAAVALGIAAIVGTDRHAAVFFGHGKDVNLSRGARGVDLAGQLAAWCQRYLGLGECQHQLLMGRQSPADPLVAVDQGAVEGSAAIGGGRVRLDFNANVGGRNGPGRTAHEKAR